MKLLLLLAFAASASTAFAIADTEPVVPISALQRVEAATDNRFKPDGPDPWDLLGEARGTYLPGYGAVFTSYLQLVTVTPISPFHLTVTPEEIKTAHDRKIKKLPLLKGAVQDLMVTAATQLNTLPLTEQITFEIYFFSFSYEDRKGLPRRLTMSVNRQKLLDAVNRHATPAAIAALIEEREE